MTVGPTDNVDALPCLPQRAAESHKGDYGRALVIGGSQGMSGAVMLAGMAALRGGAGLVTLAVPSSIQDVVAGFEPSYLTVGLPSDASGLLEERARGDIDALLDRATAVAVGPGLGRSAALTKLVCGLYADTSQPAVFDADGLNALSGKPDKLVAPGGPRILTPHVGEFARLTHEKNIKKADFKTRTAAAVDFARRCRVILVLKGHQTIITDGQQTFVNTTGNPGMATGGSGDVLTGLTTALLCQGLSPLDAARLGVYVHGRAGDLAADELGQVAMIASDLLQFLAPALREVSSE